MRLPASNGDMSKGLLLLLFDDIAESSHGVNRLAFTGARGSSEDPKICVRLTASNSGMSNGLLSFPFDNNAGLVTG